jgi:hypothetical protein
MDSYLVRLWRPDPPEPLDARLRGVVRRVDTGQERAFASEAELLDFLRADAGDPLLEEPSP